MARPPPVPYRDERASYDFVGTPHRLDESDPDGLIPSQLARPLSEAVRRVGTPLAMTR
jgi:hypothetical protein